ncbi:MAG: hypothetical protein ACK5SM_00985 [Sphingomonadales bacterium]
MIESTCPRCNSIHRSADPITEFACCAHTTVRNDRSLVQVIRLQGREYQPSKKLDKPGDEVYFLIKKHFGIHPPTNCPCRKIQRRMNALGWRKCLDITDDLEQALAENASQFGWGVTIAAATQAVLTGALAWLHPLQPWRSLIVEGCRRAREAAENADS